MTRKFHSFIIYQLALSAIFAFYSNRCHASPIDPVELTLIRRSVESYITKIQRLHVTYTCRQTNRDTTTAKALARTLERIDATNMANAKTQQTKDVLDAIRLKHRAHETIGLCDLMWDLNRCTLAIETRDANTPSHIFEKSRVEILGQTFQSINYLSRQASRSTQVTNADLTALPDLPLGFLGLKCPIPSWLPLISILSYPEVTSKEGIQNLRGQDVVILKIGPFIDSVPPDIAGTRLLPQGFIRLFLDPQKNHMPLRAEIHHPSQSDASSNDQTRSPQERMSVVEFTDFTQFRDILRDDPFLFPRQILFTNAFYARHYTFQTIKINYHQPLKPWHIEIPVGYAISINGALPVLYGGVAEKQRGIAKTTEVVRQRLATPPNKAPKRPIYWYLLGTGSLLGLLTIGTIVVLQRRTNHP